MMSDPREPTVRLSKQACGRCGKDPAAGYAGVDGVRYCHGDDDPEPTCYMRASYISARVPTGAMFEHARRLSVERNWKDVQP